MSKQSLNDYIKSVKERLANYRKLIGVDKQQSEKFLNLPIIVIPSVNGKNDTGAYKIIKRIQKQDPSLLKDVSISLREIIIPAKEMIVVSRDIDEIYYFKFDTDLLGDMLITYRLISCDNDIQLNLFNPKDVGGELSFNVCSASRSSKTKKYINENSEDGQLKNVHYELYTFYLFVVMLEYVKSINKVPCLGKIVTCDADDLINNESPNKKINSEVTTIAYLDYLPQKTIYVDAEGELIDPLSKTITRETKPHYRTLRAYRYRNHPMYQVPNGLAINFKPGIEKPTKKQTVFKIKNSALFGAHEENNNMENFIKAIQQFENKVGDRLSCQKKDYTHEYDFTDDEEELHIKILSFCDDLLITESGSPNYQNIDLLRKHGYIVTPGETDSFGWLTGCLKTSIGTVVFG